MIEFGDADQIYEVCVDEADQDQRPPARGCNVTALLVGSRIVVVNPHPSLRDNTTVSQRLNVSIQFITFVLNLIEPAKLGAGASLS